MSRNGGKKGARAKVKPPKWSDEVMKERRGKRIAGPEKKRYGGVSGIKRP